MVLYGTLLVIPTAIQYCMEITNQNTWRAAGKEIGNQVQSTLVQDLIETNLLANTHPLLFYKEVGTQEGDTTACVSVGVGPFSVSIFVSCF